MITLDHISSGTPMGANLVVNGATFRVWAPGALEVHVLGSFNNWQRSVGAALQNIGGGNWAGFASGARDGSEYLFYVVGVGGEGFKRDPYARELTTDPPFPSCNCIIRDPGTFLWHDAQFRTPDFHNFVIYQLHVGTFSIPSRKINGGFLDVIDRLDHLEQLGISAVQFLPVVEFPTQFSLGYNGTDYFSPENDYEVTRLGGDEELKVYLDRINSRLTARGLAPYSINDLDGSSNQLRVLIDLCHLHGIAVILDVVYNHAGGGFDDQSIYYFDRAENIGNNNDSLYFTNNGWAGGLVFAYWKG